MRTELSSSWLPGLAAIKLLYPKDILFENDGKCNYAILSFVSVIGQGSAAFMAVIKLLCSCCSNPVFPHCDNRKRHVFALCAAHQSFLLHIMEAVSNPLSGFYSLIDYHDAAMSPYSGFLCLCASKCQIHFAKHGRRRKMACTLNSLCLFCFAGPEST